MMDWQLRIALIVIGILVIGYIVFDYNRRKKSNADKQRLIDQMHASADHVDSTGFDITGVGNARKAGEPGLSEFDENEQTNSLAETQIRKPHRTTNPAPTEQLNLNAVADTKQSSSVSQEKEQQAETVEQESVEPELVISLILKAEAGDSFKGKDFMPLLLSQGLRHGDMGIFHRHSGASGKPGPIMYSVANAINPGTFDLKNIEVFETPAFAFFMTLPGPIDAIASFEGMVKTIRLLKNELGGQILDQSKSVYTEQTYQHHRDSLREYVAKTSVK